jgi:hypothetical protein
MKVRLIANASNHGGQVAQSVEQRTENPCVECSIHSLPTKKARKKTKSFRAIEPAMIEPMCLIVAEV